MQRHSQIHTVLSPRTSVPEVLGTVQVTTASMQAVACTLVSVLLVQLESRVAKGLANMKLETSVHCMYPVHSTMKVGTYVGTGLYS